MYKALLIAFTFFGEQKTQDIDRALSAVGDDWIRIANNNWIVWTARSEDDWFALVKPYASATTHILVLQVLLGKRPGWQPAWVWEWLRAKNEQQERTARQIIDALMAPKQPGLGMSEPKYTPLLGGGMPKK